MAQGYGQAEKTLGLDCVLAATRPEGLGNSYSLKEHFTVKLKRVSLEATSNKCHASSNKRLLETSALLLVTRI